MNCSDVQNLMPEYVSHALSPKLSEDMAQHIDSCEGCRSWLEEVLELQGIWQDSRPVPGLDLVTPVLYRLDAEAGQAQEYAEAGQTQEYVKKEHTQECVEAGYVEEYVKPSGLSKLDVSVSEHAQNSLNEQSKRKSRWKLPSIVLLHYGVAASLTLVLFQFGVFSRLGELALHSAMLSNEIHNLLMFLFNYSF